MMNKILVVDDSAYYASLLTAILRKKGLDVDVAKDSDEAIQKYKEHRFGIIFLDVMLPGKSGIQTLEELKKIDPDVISIIVTSLKTHDDVKKAKEAGASGYIVKPFKAEKVYDFLKKFHIIDQD